MTTQRHPYVRLTGSPQWTAIDRAVCELAENQDLVETTAHDYIVGYLCEALGATSGQEAGRRKVTSIRDQSIQADALRRVRAAVKKANPSNRNLAQELIQERRLEAKSE
jgi:hypothetical protein